MDFDRVLVFGAHPGDEVKGVGGTIAKLSLEGAEVNVVIFTKKEGSYGEQKKKRNVKRDSSPEISEVDRMLGVENRTKLNEPIQDVKSSTANLQRCVEIIRECKPDVIFSHANHDKHRDHKAVATIVDEARWQAATRMFPGSGKPWSALKLYYYETLDPFTFPHLVVDITDTFKEKKEALKMNIARSGSLPENRVLQYVEGIAKVRGYRADCDYAEAFKLSHTVPTVRN